MRFSEVPAGVDLFLDANTLIYHFTAHPLYGAVCKQLIHRVRRGQIGGVTSTHILGEVAHRMMAIEAVGIFGWPIAGIAQRLRQHPAQVQQLTQFRRAIEQVPRFEIRILTIPPQLVSMAAAISQQTGLLSNDALLVAVMREHGLTNLASHDADFDRVTGLTRFGPV
jgi:predicted nucleic acid-binding protein